MYNEYRNKLVGLITCWALVPPATLHHVEGKNTTLTWICCSWVLRRSLTSQVISVAFYSERENSDKFCAEALISTWGSLTCRKPTTREPRFYFPYEGFLRSEKNPSTPAGFEPGNLGSSGEYDNHGTIGVDRDNDVTSWPQLRPQ